MRIKEPYELACEVCQGVVVTLLECREIERMLTADELLRHRQRGLSHAPPTLKYCHLQIALGIYSFEFSELLLSSA